MIGERRATDLDQEDLESALLRAAVGDYALEAAVLLLVNSGAWLPQLQAAGLVSIALDGEADDPLGHPLRLDHRGHRAQFPPGVVARLQVRGGVDEGRVDAADGDP